jgi:hypothetical protein
VPWRVTEKLVEGELTRDEFITLVYLVSKISHEHWRKPPDAQVLVTTLDVIKSETGWTKTTARLSQVIASLEEKRWVGTDTRGGSKRWRIWLIGAAVVDERQDTASETSRLDQKNEETGVQDFEVSSKHDERKNSRNDDGETENKGSKLRNGVASLEVDEDVDVEVDVTSRAADTDAAALASAREPHPEKLDEDVERAITNLVELLGDSDERTAWTFRRNFGHLRAADFDFVYEQLRFREGVANDAAYAYEILRSIDQGHNGSPDDIDRRLGVDRRSADAVAGLFDDIFHGSVIEPEPERSTSHDHDHG